MTKKSNKSVTKQTKKSTKKASAGSEKAAASTVQAVLAKRLREGSFILVLAAAGFWLLAMFSYHLSDSAWSSYNGQHSVANAAGVAGAWLADFTLYFCGYLAFIMPLVLCYLGWVYCFATHRKQRYGKLTRCFQVFGILLIVIAAAALVNLFIRQPILSLPLTSGGVIGAVVAQQMQHAFNQEGAILLLYAMLLVGITLSSGLSWLKVVELVGRGIYKLIAYFGVGLRYLVVSLGSALRAAGPWLRSQLQLLRERAAKRAAAKVEAKAKAEAKKAQQLASLAAQQAEATQKASKPKIVIAKEKPVPVVKTMSVEDRLAQLKAKTQAAASGELPEHLQPTAGQRPTLDLLDEHVSSAAQLSNEDLEARSREVELKLADFKIQAEVVAVHPGPVVTRYEIALAAGTKASKITSLAKDLARSLSVLSVRVVEVIPGKSVIGLELPNNDRDIVSLREVFDSEAFRGSASTLTMALGKDIAGHAVTVDLAKMPHLLVAGTTGSGKSVGLNAMLLSLLYKSTPEELRIILIDPKMLELAIYEEIPHLLVPVVTDMKEAANALRWCVVEMERRYRLMAALGVRNIAGFNQKIKEAAAAGEPIPDPMIEQAADSDEIKTLEALPKIVIIADEFADMMMVVGKKIEVLIARLAQKARAAGIHLIFATQRPSVDVITGLIKANIPTRIAFQVSSRIDSRTIIDQQGAEQLLGHGDMLYLAPGTGIPRRVHGAFVDDDEVHRVVKFLKATAKPNYLTEILGQHQEQQAADSDPVLASLSDSGDDNANQRDALFDQAVEFVAQSRKASISSLQRRFKIGYNRAARIIEQMEAEGMVSAMENGAAREVLLPPPRED